MEVTDSIFFLNYLVERAPNLVLDAPEKRLIKWTACALRCTGEVGSGIELLTVPGVVPFYYFNACAPSLITY